MFAQPARAPQRKASSSAKDSHPSESAKIEAVSETMVINAPAYSYSLADVPVLPPSNPRSDPPPAKPAPPPPASLPNVLPSNLTIGAVDDPREREADKAAGNALSTSQHPDPMPRSSVASAASASAPPIVHQVLRSPGQPLSPAARAFFEPRFGYDLSRIRVHTDAQAGASADAIQARAYAAGNRIVFASGQYGHTDPDRTQLLAHELAHVLQQHPSGPVLRRSPTTTVNVNGKNVDLPQGPGGSGAVVYFYTGQRMTTPAGVQQRADEIKKEKADKTFDPKKLPDNPDLHDSTKSGSEVAIQLPVLVYPPPAIKSPSVDVFVFFHGMRATYGEESKGNAQGSEKIGEMTQLKQSIDAANAVGGKPLVGIAPQAPETYTWNGNTKTWGASSGQWQEALQKIGGFDGLVQLALDSLSKDLGITLTPENIHVAGHSAGGHGILEATATGKGAKTLGDKVQDLTLQDATYGFGWAELAGWLLDGSPGKTVRVLLSNAEGGPGGNTRNGLEQFLNLDSIKAAIDSRGNTDLDVVHVPVDTSDKQKPRPGGFVLGSELKVQNKKSGQDQATIVFFLAPGGGHYVTTSASMGAAAMAAAKDSSASTDFLGTSNPGKFRIAGGPGAQVPVYPNPDLKDAKKLPTLPLDTEVEVTEFKQIPGKPNVPADPKSKKAPPKSDDDFSENTPAFYVAKVKVDQGGKTIEGWVRMSNLINP